MNKKKKTSQNLNELGINEKIKEIRNILNSLEQILIMLSPLMDKILSMEETSMYHKDGSFKMLIELFDNISKECNKLSTPIFSPELPDDFIADLRN